MDLESGKVKHFTTGQHEGSVRNACVDPLMEYVATVGCDGKMHVININEMSCSRKQPISETKALNYTSQALELKWSHDGNFLYVAGDNNLQVHPRRPTTEVSPLTQIKHLKPISHIVCPSPDVMITLGLDRQLCVFNI